MTDKPAQPSEPETKAVQSIGRKIGISAALVVLPVGAAVGYLQLKAAGERKNNGAEQGSSYNMEALKKIDPSMIKYQQTGQIATGLKYARAIAVDKTGRILVAGDRTVRVLSANGELQSEMVLTDFPTCVAGLDNGTILVGLRDHVEVYDGKSPAKHWKPLGEKSQLTGMALVGNEVYLADAGRRVVVRCDLDGKILGEIGRRDEGRGVPGIVLPSAYLNVSGVGNGEVLVSNAGRHRVERYGADGELRGFFGSASPALAGFIGCCNPSQLAVLADGRVVTAEKGVARIKVYLPDGTLDGVVAGPETLGAGANGFELATDAAGRILVLERGTDHIRIFTPKDGSTTAKADVAAFGQGAS
jgi:hypothetical protein